MLDLGVSRAVRQDNQLSFSQHLPRRHQHLELLSSWWPSTPVQLAALQGVGIDLLKARRAEHCVPLPQLSQSFRRQRHVRGNVETSGHTSPYLRLDHSAASNYRQKSGGCEIMFQLGEHCFFTRRPHSNSPFHSPGRGFSARRSGPKHISTKVAESLPPAWVQPASTAASQASTMNIWRGNGDQAGSVSGG
jgi:hypothetical protein